MRSLPKMVLGTALLALLLPACHGDGGQEQEQRKGLSRLTQRDRLFDAQFVGDQLFVVGFPGIILHSADRGATFEFQDGGLGEALFAVDFVDEANGFIVGRDGLVLSTSDAGKSWTRLDSGVKESLFDLDFVDAQNGWLVGNFGLILHTADGGKTFQRQTVTEEEEGEEEGVGGRGLGAGEDADSASGSESGSDSASGSESGSDSASGSDSPEPEAEPEEDEPAFDRLLNGVSFVDAQTGWIAGESGILLVTHDAGKKWVPVDCGEWAPLYSVMFVDRKHGFVAGSEGAFLFSGDAGETWARLETGTTEHLFRLARTQDGVVAVGRRGVMLAVPLVPGDGGLVPGEVRRVQLGVYQWLSSASFGPDGAGIVVGGQGLVMQTRDGGAAWTRPAR